MTRLFGPPEAPRASARGGRPARGPRRLPWLRWPRLVVALVLLLVAGARAETIRIDTGGDPDSRFEIRTVVLPGGEERDLYVVSADQVVVRTEDRTLTARRIEFDPDAGVVRIVGHGRVESASETLVGEDLVVELDGGRMDGDDVLVITDRIDVRGETASRVEGRVRLMQGGFSPCARCGQRTEDYGFVAERIEILPGDRLIAWNATLLVRETPVLDLPLMVVPLADPSRTPRLELRSGTASERAEVRIDWPYVSGPNAFGTASLRLLMDVDPTAGGFVDGALLGGAVQRAYLAGAVDHRFFTERGSGRLEAAYLPPMTARDGGEAEPSRIRFSAEYATDEHAGLPSVRAFVRRDDEERDRLVEAQAVVTAEAAGLRAEVSSRVAIPLTPDADLRPTWDGANEPRTIPLRLRLEPVTLEELRVGPLRLTELELDIGVFEDSPDPTNRSAAGARYVTAGRVLERHVLELDRSRVFGVDVHGRLDFVGRYYDTGERLIDWDTWIEASRRFGDLGALTVRLQRDTAEGETPFAFDRIPLRTRSELTATLDLRPMPALDLQVRTGYVFEDDRRPDEEGFGPVETRVEAFPATRWVDLVVLHRADPRVDDIGTIDTLAALRAPGRDLRAELEVEALLDLDPSRPDDVVEDESRVDLVAALGAPDILVAEAELGRVATAPDDATGPWEPLELTLAAGTLRDGDARPGLELAWELDPNDGTTLAAGYAFAADAGPFRAELRQRFGPADGRPGDHEYRLSWTDVLAVEVEGPELLPGSWLGLAADPTASRRLVVRVVEDRERGSPRFRAEYRATHVPLPDGDVQTRASTLTASAQLADRRLPGGWGRVALDAFVDVPLEDDALERSYLRRANLELGLDIAGRVGLQGTVGYRGRYDAAVDEVTSGRLALEEVSLVVHPTQELYVGATIDDVWEIVDDTPGDLAIDPRPRLFATWDRCCWALYGSWDTRTGEMVITLGAPGVREGPQLAFPEGPVVPWGDDGPSAAGGGP